MSGKAYAGAGVDVDLGNLLKRGIHAKVKGTHGPQVLGKIGGFGGLFSASFPEMKEPVLVSSIDGVGTKLMIAVATGRHDTVAQDLVNHCVNDIAVLGARPLFFLDYIGAEKLEPTIFKQLISGFAKACKAAKCALIGGETAQLPGLYRPGEYDLVGCIVGVVDRPKMIDGSRVLPGDAIVGLPSNGLHTNGYSLARRVLFDRMKLSLDAHLDGASGSLGDELLRVHRNYQPVLSSIRDGVLKGAAHITGGGLLDNLPRVLPANCDAVIDGTTWKVPPIFSTIQRGGGIDPLEMYQVFNMGVGMALIVADADAADVARRTRGKLIGRIEKGNRQVRLTGLPDGN